MRQIKNLLDNKEESEDKIKICDFLDRGGEWEASLFDGYKSKKLIKLNMEDDHLEKYEYYLCITKDNEVDSILRRKK